VTREAEGLHEGTLNVELMAKQKLPQQIVDTVEMWGHNTEVVGALWRHRQTIGGCYTHKLKTRDVQALRMAAALISGTDKPYGRVCALQGCGEGHGTFRHVQMVCKGEGMEGLRRKLWDSVENALRKHKTVGEWLQAAGASHAEGGCGHPKGWTGAGEHWSVLSALGWLLPIGHEDEFEERTEKGRPSRLEGAYDLAYRGVVPKALAEHLQRAPHPGLQEEADDRRDKAVWDVAASIMAVGMKLNKKYAKRLGERLKQVSDEHEERDEREEDGAQQAPGDAPTQQEPRAIKRCEGEPCAERYRTEGTQPKEATAKGKRCQRCQRRLRETMDIETLTAAGGEAEGD
jgi:hypothetical protein